MEALTEIVIDADPFGSWSACRHCYEALTFDNGLVQVWRGGSGSTGCGPDRLHAPMPELGDIQAALIMANRGWAP